MMTNLIYLGAGLALGIILGWAIFLIMIPGESKPKDPPTKDEWKVM